MDTLLQDVRYALRSLRRQPAFAALAMLTLALGIGANAAIFTVVNAVLLRPLDYRDPDRIVAVTTLWQKTGRTARCRRPDFHDWHDTATSFERHGGLHDGAEDERVGGRRRRLRVARRASRRGFSRCSASSRRSGTCSAPPNERAGGPLTAVIGHDFWFRRFGGTPRRARAHGHVRRSAPTRSSASCRRGSGFRTERTSGRRRRSGQRTTRGRPTTTASSRG